MNNICKVVWSHVHQQFVVVSEIASTLGKAKSTRVVSASGAPGTSAIQANIRTLCMAVACAVLAPAAWAQTAALPAGGQVVAGQGSIQTQGSVMTVNQASQRMALDWQSFNIGAGQTVNFVQPNAQATALNRVLGSDVSTIQGQINANGRVYLLNPNGILFTPSAQVNVGGLVASTLGMSTADFMAGNDRLAGDSISAVTNQGQIRTAQGGTVALVAARVTNVGEISAPSGSALLAAGRKVRLDLGGPTQIEVEEGALNALIEQSGSIRAADGMVYLTAKAASQLSVSAINQSGLIEAGSIDANGGLVVLEADHIRLGSGSRIDATGAKGGGTVLVGGDWQGSGSLRQATAVTMESGSVIDASALDKGNGGKVVLWSDVHNPSSISTASGAINARGGTNGGDGGQVETSGAQLNMGSIRVDASASTSSGKSGFWLIDPYDYVIDATAATNIAAALDTGTSGTNVTVTTSTSNAAYGAQASNSGDITVGSAITASKSASLSLIADRDITVNADITLGGGALMMKAVRNVILSYDKQISTNGGNVTFWADSGGSRVGGIRIGADASPLQNPAVQVGNLATLVATNGGDIVLGGGNVADPSSAGYASYEAGLGMSNAAYYYAIGVFGSTLDASSSVPGRSGGNIVIRGDAGNTFNGMIWTVQLGGAAGAISDNTFIKTNGAGTISVLGNGSDAPPNAVANNSRNSWAVTSTGTVQTENGAIEMIGIANTLRTNARGFSLRGAIQSATGPITIWDQTANTSAANYSGPYINGTAFGKGTLSSSSSDVTIIADKLYFEPASSINTTGHVTIKPSGNSFLKLNNVAGFNTTYIDIQRAGDLTLGKSTNTADITIGRALTVDNETTIYSSGSVTQTAALVSPKLLLEGIAGVGNFTLQNASNNVGTLAASNVGDVKFKNSAAMTVGTVGGADGISSAGVVDVQTVSGNLVVAKNITTSSTATNAVILDSSSGTNIASAAPAVGADTAGDILIGNGVSITTGANGRVVLYTGSIDNSTGVDTAAGSGNLRYGSDETTTRFNTATVPLGSSGTFAIYREAPTVADGTHVYGDFLGLNVGSYTGTSFTDLGYASGGNVTVTPRPINITVNSGQGKVYGNADPTLTYTLEANSAGRGLVSGDTFSGALARAAGVNVGGSYAITQGTLANSNYTINFTGGNFAITPRPINITVNSGQSKVYGNADPALTYTLEANSAGRGLVNGDTFSGALERAAGANVGNSYAITQGTLVNSNYTINFTGGNFAVTPRLITLAIDSKNKRSGDADPAWTYQLLNGSLLSGDELTLSRLAGEAPGKYLISAANPNYQISADDAYLNVANRIESPTLVNGLLTVAPVQPAAQTTSSPALSVPQAGAMAPVAPASPSNPMQVSSGLMMIPVAADQAKVLETAAAPSSDKASGSTGPAAAGWLQSAQALGYTGVLVVEGGVRLPEGVR